MRTLLILCLFCLSANALVIIYDNDTKDIYTVSEKDDTIVPEGMTKEVISGDLSTYALTENPTNCKFINKRFIVNSEKINEIYQAQQEAQEIAEENELINQKIKDMAIEKLNEDGVILKHHKKKEKK